MKKIEVTSHIEGYLIDMLLLACLIIDIEHCFNFAGRQRPQLQKTVKA